MKRWTKGMVMMMVAAFLAPLSGPARGKDAPLPLIPRPAEVERLPGEFVFGPETPLILMAEAGDDWLVSAQLFAAKVKERRGFTLKVLRADPREARECPAEMIMTPGSCTLAEGAIIAGPVLSAGVSEMESERVSYPAEEGYCLRVGRSVLVEAQTAHGFHNALMTLLQLMSAGDSPSVLPAVRIVDYPRFAWRGLLLDSARSFHPPDVIESYIDRMSELKLTVLHWHLVDDQGWRIESRTFPRLHEVGGILSVLNERKKRALDRHGWGRSGRGYYTQEELRHLVAFARERHVRIVPEIDVPGHCSALLAAYPELSCSGRQVPVRSKPGIYPTALCPAKEEVYDFLDQLFAELAEIFPDPYLHIGSDEVFPADWKEHPGCQELMARYGFTDNAGLQSYFVGRVNEILKKHGRTLIGWDEITVYAPEGAVVQAWRKHDFARQAAEAGHDSIVSPVTHCYIDYPQLLYTLKNLYHFEPVPDGLAPDLQARILGGEINLWGERVTLGNMDKKVFPRLFAHAEVMWSPAEGRQWDDFLARLQSVQKEWEAGGVKFGLTWHSLLLGRR